MQISDRERAVLDAMAQGDNLKAAAVRLGLSYGYVRNIVATLRRLYGARSNVQLVAEHNKRRAGGDGPVC